MDFETVWQELRDRSEALDPDDVLVTPSTERAFTVQASEEDRFVVEFEDDGERSLRRDQFEVLFDRLDALPDGVSLSDLPAGVEPYVSVLSLSPRVAVDESARTMRRVDDGERGESPFVRPGWTARTPPERVRDDAVLLADVLEGYDVSSLDALPAEALVNLYVLLSDVQRGADGLRRDVGDALLEHIGPDARLHGSFGTVTRTVRERRLAKDDETVLDALDEEGIPHEWVLGVDPEKLDVVLAVTDLDERDVYDVDEQVYVQKTGVEEGEKQTRLQGLRDRLAALETEDAEGLREDIEELEERIDTALASG